MAVNSLRRGGRREDGTRQFADRRNFSKRASPPRARAASNKLS